MFWGVILSALLLPGIAAGQDGGGELEKGQIRDTELDERGQAPGAAESGLYEHFSPRVVSRGKEYRHTKYLVFFLRSAVTIAFLALVVKFRGMEWLAGHLGAVLPERTWITAGIYATLLTVALAFVVLPLSLYSGYFHEHSFGLSTRDLAGWFGDLGKHTLLQVLLAFILFAVFYRIMQGFPTWWWLVSAGCFTVFLIFMTAVSPLVIAPLFHKFTPVEDERLREEIVELADRAGLRVENVLEMNASTRTRKLNAYFTGIGNTKRVVLYDNLVEKGSLEEVRVVLAHELGHWKRNHLWKGIGLAALGTVVVLLVIRMVLTGSFAGDLGIRPFHHPAGVPLVMLIILGLGYLSMPIQNAISRHFERQADMDSLVLTDDPGTFIRVEEKIGKTNLNDVDPHPVIEWVLFTHPPTIDRIRMAEDYRDRSSSVHEEER